MRVHPENGRKALYLNPVRIEAIEGMTEEEALALVAELMAHATQKKYEYRHKWRYGDMVIWDNRSVMHQANGDYDMNEVRHLLPHHDHGRARDRRRAAARRRLTCEGSGSGYSGALRSASTSCMRQPSGSRKLTVMRPVALT